MFSFDLSTTSVFLTVAVVALFIIFVALLMKLNPSTEPEEKIETATEDETQKLPRTLPIAPKSPSPPTNFDVSKPVAERPMVTVNAATGGTSSQSKQEGPMPFRNESREIPKPEKNPTPKAGSFPSKRDCVHHFGYLRTFPKNSPIPDECFGCEKIVDCLVNKKPK